MLGLYRVLIFAFALTVPHHAGAEGAYAYGQGHNGAWSGGSAYNYSTAQEAIDSATQRCEQRGIPCQLVTQVQSTCFAVAVQNGNNGWGWATRGDLSDARREALQSCQRNGLECSISEAFCDAVIEQQKALICVRPTFEQETKLRAMIDGSDARTREVADAILYIRDRFCRTTTDTMVSDTETHLSDNCYQYSGLFRGERVYWGQCLE
jgi:hypothetical protein